MWTVISVSIILIVFLFGVSELIRMCVLSIMRPSGDPPHVMIIFLKDDICVQQLRSAIEFLSWEGRRSFFAISAIDCGLSQKNREIIKRIADENINVFFGQDALYECLNDYYCGK